MTDVAAGAGSSPTGSVFASMLPGGFHVQPMPSMDYVEPPVTQPGPTVDYPQSGVLPAGIKSGPYLNRRSLRGPTPRAALSTGYSGWLFQRWWDAVIRPVPTVPHPVVRSAFQPVNLPHTYQDVTTGGEWAKFFPHVPGAGMPGVASDGANSGLTFQGARPNNQDTFPMGASQAKGYVRPRWTSVMNYPRYSTIPPATTLNPTSR